MKPFVLSSLESLYQLNDSSILDDLVIAYQTFAIILNPSCKFAKSMQEWSLYNEMVKQKIRLHDVLDRHPDKRSYENKSKNESEAKYVGMVRKQLGQSPDGVELLNNILLHGFEADIVIRKTSIVNGIETVVVVNIELDGPSHKRDFSKKHFCELRDDYLRREHGIRICLLYTSPSPRD